MRHRDGIRYGTVWRNFPFPTAPVVQETFRNYFFASIGAKFCLLGHFYFVLDKIIIPPPRPLILPIFHTIDELVHQVCDPL